MITFIATNSAITLLPIQDYEYGRTDQRNQEIKEIVEAVCQITKRPDASPSLLRSIAEWNYASYGIEDSDFCRIWAHLAAHPNVPLDIVRDLLKSEGMDETDWQIFDALLNNPAFPLYHLEDPDIAGCISDSTALLMTARSETPRVYLLSLYDWAEEWIRDWTTNHITFSGEMNPTLDDWITGNREGLLQALAQTTLLPCDQERFVELEELGIVPGWLTEAIRTQLATEQGRFQMLPFDPFMGYDSIPAIPFPAVVMGESPTRRRKVCLRNRDLKTIRRARLWQMASHPRTAIPDLYTLFSLDDPVIDEILIRNAGMTTFLLMRLAKRAYQQRKWERLFLTAMHPNLSPRHQLALIQFAEERYALRERLPLAILRNPLLAPTVLVRLLTAESPIVRLAARRQLPAPSNGWQEAMGIEMTGKVEILHGWSWLPPDFCPIRFILASRCRQDCATLEALMRSTLPADRLAVALNRNAPPEMHAWLAEHEGHKGVRAAAQARLLYPDRDFGL
jgi:hypothetical protein